MTPAPQSSHRQNRVKCQDYPHYGGEEERPIQHAGLVVILEVSLVDILETFKEPFLNS